MAYHPNFRIYSLYQKMKKLLTVLLLQLGCLSGEMPEEPCQGELTLTLESAISLALNNNRSLMNTTESVTKAEYQVSVAEYDFDWQVSPNAEIGYIGGGSVGSGTSCGGGFDFSKKLRCGTTFTVSPFIQRAHEHWNANMKTVMTQPLLRGRGREYTQSQLRGAEFSLRSSQRSLYTAQAQLIVRTVTSMYEIIKAKKNVQLNEASLKRIEKFYQAAKLKEKIGLSDALDVYRAEIEQRRAEEAHTAAQEKLQDCEDTLRDILALPMDTCLTVEIPLKFSPVNISSEEAIDISQKNRIEILQAEDQWCESRRLSMISKENLWPELNMVVNFSNNGSDAILVDSCNWRNRESRWGIGFTSSSDFNPVGLKSAYEQSLLAIDAANRNIDQTRANITLETKRALRHLERASQRIELETEQIKTSEGELHLSQIKFDRGMANNFDVIQAEKNLRSAQLNYWNALIDHIIGEYKLLEALGLLMEKPQI